MYYEYYDLYYVGQTFQAHNEGELQQIKILNENCHSGLNNNKRATPQMYNGGMYRPQPNVITQPAPAWRNKSF